MTARQTRPRPGGMALHAVVGLALALTGCGWWERRREAADAPLQGVLSHYLRPRRRRRISVVGPAPPGLRQVTGWFMRHPDRLSESENKQLTEALARCPELAAAHRLVHSFAAILSTRTGQHLKNWVVSARAEDLPGLHSFATGLERDWDAVVQGLTSHWNSGPVEGRVNHIKMIKRQMFGRAKLPLLRERVLLTAAR
ncbi:transposase [Streptomyces sp. NBC_01212]|uniref:transposase n=1 Tax=Streptomyces sp. NBC_01212 TaxID=2903775 RepID=UPI002E161038|nr:transposase [Streptomyces sp. NBC_01212]